MRSLIFFICTFIVLSLFFIPALALAGGPEISLKNHGFYLTADIAGASFQKQNTSTTNVIFTGAGIAGGVSDTEIADRNSLSFAWSGGFGWQFSSLFRMDVTYTYLRFPLIFHIFNTAAIGPLATTIAFSSGRTDVYLINAYLDLLSLFHQHSNAINPYIGVGLGWADNKTRNTTVAVNIVPSVNFFVSKGDRSDFSYRLIAGFTYSLTTGLRIFAQYSYLSGGKYESGTRLTSSIGDGIFTVPSKFHLHSSIFSAGLVYLF